jgi:hypothetical protein
LAKLTLVQPQSCTGLFILCPLCHVVGHSQNGFSEISILVQDGGGAT